MRRHFLPAVQWFHYESYSQRYERSFMQSGSLAFTYLGSFPAFNCTLRALLCLVESQVPGDGDVSRGRLP